jgi:hypothetical protein
MHCLCIEKREIKALTKKHLFHKPRGPEIWMSVVNESLLRVQVGAQELEGQVFVLHDLGVHQVEHLGGFF